MSARGIYLEREVIESDAFRALSKTATYIYLVFLTKRRMENHGSQKRQHWIITNNGEIEFTYKEAQKKWGIKQSTFLRGRDQLIETGFIDIAQSGGGLCKSKTLYAVSERWKKYNTPISRRSKEAEEVVEWMRKR